MGTSQTKSPQILNIDIPFDGLGLISIPASETISPVFTMWITLVAMYTGMPMKALSTATICQATRTCSATLSKCRDKTTLLVQFTAGQTIRQLLTCAREVHPVCGVKLPKAPARGGSGDTVLGTALHPRRTQPCKGRPHYLSRLKCSFGAIPSEA